VVEAHGKDKEIQGDFHGQSWTTWLLWKEGFKPSDIHRQLSAIRGEKAPARNTVQLGTEIQQWQENWPGRSTPEELFCEDIRKLSRRWERFITKRGI